MIDFHKRARVILSFGRVALVSLVGVFIKKLRFSAMNFGIGIEKDGAILYNNVCTQSNVEEAAVWALENELCPNPDVLRYALQVRREPLKHKRNEQTLDYAETLAEPIQRFADVLEEELKKQRGQEE